MGVQKWERLLQDEYGCDGGSHRICIGDVLWQCVFCLPWSGLRRSPYASQQRYIFHFWLLFRHALRSCTSYGVGMPSGRWAFDTPRRLPPNASRVVVTSSRCKVRHPCIAQLLRRQILVRIFGNASTAGSYMMLWSRGRTNRSRTSITSSNRSYRVTLCTYRAPLPFDTGLSSARAASS